jgi:hypothetical protein
MCLATKPSRLHFTSCLPNSADSSTLRLRACSMDCGGYGTGKSRLTQANWEVANNLVPLTLDLPEGWTYRRVCVRPMRCCYSLFPRHIMHVEVAAFLYLAVAGVYAILRATGTEPLDMLKKEDRQ